MNSKRVYFVLLGLIGLLFLLLMGGAYGVDQLLHAKANHLVALKLQDQVLQQQKVGLKKAKEQVTAYTPLNNVAKTIVPEDKDQAEAVREISNLAAQSGITQLSSVTFPQSTLGGVSTSTGASGATSPPTAGSTSQNKLTQLLPVKGAAGLYQLQITIQQTGDNPVPYDEFLTFLSKLEQNRRTAQVSTINLQPDSKRPSYVGFSLTVNEFIRP